MLCTRLGAPAAVAAVVVAFASMLQVASAHGDTSQVPINSKDWATRHMAEEHHIISYDAATFFTLHDYDHSGAWTAEEILRTYGLGEGRAPDVPREKRDEVTRQILKLADADHDGKISRQEWLDFDAKGGRLPDFGLGPGHHHDDEWEYELHHFEKYHDENTKEEDLNHPEDIEHFKKHEEDAMARERQEKLDAMPIVEQNIPAKFRRNS